MNANYQFDFDVLSYLLVTFFFVLEGDDIIVDGVDAVIITNNYTITIMLNNPMNNKRNLVDENKKRPECS